MKNIRDYNYTENTKISALMLHYFNTSKIFEDSLLSKLSGRYQLDIIQFDIWLHTQGYKEEIHGSAADYVQKFYGDKALAFIEELIKN